MLIPLTLRRGGAALLALVVAVVLAACGASAGSEADGAGSADPIVIEHVYGKTEITGVPERVVAIDVQWIDTMLALDVDLLGYSRDAYMPDNVVPWQKLPEDAEGLDVANGIPVERIAALKPDLIVGSFSIKDQTTYDQLSAIAPTIPNLDGQEVTPWQDLVSLAGDVLERPADAKAIIDEVDGAVAETAADLPGLKGQTFSLAQYVVGDSIYVVADEKDGSSVFFHDLGMKMYPPVKERGEQTGEARIQISTERSDMLRADFVAFLVNGGTEKDLADIPGFDELPGTIAVLDYATIVGLNTPTPLSLPYSLERIRPFLEQAAS